MLLPPCPHCGYDRGVFVRAQAKGPAEVHYDSEGQQIEICYDNLYFEPSRTVRCGDCLRIRRDVSVEDLSGFTHSLQR